MKAESAAPLTAQTPVETISSQEFKTLIASRKPIYILDVRQKEEYDAGHIKNAASIPLDTLPDHINDLPKNKEIVVYCRSGKRSAQAVAFLHAQGFMNVVSLDGGYSTCTMNSMC